MSVEDHTWLPGSLERLAGAELGGAGVAVSGLEPLPGHAGLGYSFYLAAEGRPLRRMVVRTIPEGVPATGPADVVRQARIMRAMGAAGVPVPEIVWFGAEDSAFGRPFFVADFVEGYRTPDDWQKVTDRDRALGRRAMQALPRIHAVDWRRMEDTWGPQVALEAEFARLAKLLDRPTIDPASGGRIRDLSARLLETLPADTHVGCVHGDFHWGNIIFGEDEVLAIVDWEIAFVGPTLLDVGWISFYADPQAFSGAYSDRTKRFGLAPDEMLDLYQESAGLRIPPAEIAWFRAFSAYRFGVISLFNLMLHRRGKRDDPMWEEMALSVPQMAERGLELLAMHPAG